MAIYKSESRLPNTYQEVEYIESTGTQYIDTNFVPNQNTRIVCDYQDMDITVSTHAIIGVRASQTNGFGFGARANYNWYAQYGEEQTPNPLFQNDTNRHIVNFDKNKLYFDNTLIHTYQSQTFDLLNKSLHIFKWNDYNNVVNYSKSKLYSCMIYDNGTLARYYIPCYRKSDDVIGLYDLVNGVFYTNQGTGTFLKGNDVFVFVMKKVVGLYKGTTKIVKRYKGTSLIYSSSRLPSAYQEVEYIESTGTQYIDTGVVFSGNLSETTANFMYTSLPQTSYWASISGTQKDSSTRWGGIQCYGYSASLYCTAGDLAGQEGVYLGTISANEKYQVQVVTDATQKTNYAKISTGESGTVVFGGSVNTGVNLLLLAKNTAGTKAEYASARLYGYSIRIDNVLVRDFVPCYRKSDNVVGLYDLANSGKNLVASMVNNKYINNSGEEATSNNLSHTNKMEVSPNSFYTLSASRSGNTNTSAIIWFDKDDNFLYRDTATQVDTNYTITAMSPSNAKYAICNVVNQYSNVQFEKGSTATTYEPYPFYTNAGTGTFIKGNDV